MKPQSLTLLLAYLHVAIAQSNTPSVRLNNGTVRGARCPHSSVAFYYGIPYAKAPVGDLRFAPPQANDTWLQGGQQFDATNQGSICPQFEPFGASSGLEDEDCLTLDVWTPLNATNTSSLPVKVWIYGGSNADGSIADATYNGCFAATSTIMVSMNYRLGPLGWLALQSANLTGNYGFQDQLLALQWVRDNIRAFGGDPKNVLLFGQSAGAVNVFNVASSPRSSGLITAAAMESGGGRDVPTIQAVQKHNLEFIKALNCTSPSTQCLRQATIDQLKKAQSALDSSQPNVPGADTLFPNSGFGGDWSPVIDGQIITSQPSQTGSRVPSIFGSTSKDGALFVLGQYNAGFATLNSSQYTSFLTYNFGPFAPNVSAQYPLNSTTYKNASFPVFTAMTNVITDYAYKCPAYRGLTTAAKRNVTVWTYEFDHTPSCDWNSQIPNVPQIIQLLGPTHTSEIPFVLGLMENSPPPNGSCNFTSTERDISKFMLGAWDSMAKEASPGADWPGFQTGESKGVVFANQTMSGVVDYSVCEFWDGIAEGILGLNTANGSLSGNSSQGEGGSSSSSGSPPSSTPSSKSAANLVETNWLGLWVGSLLALAMATTFVA